MAVSTHPVAPAPPGPHPVDVRPPLRRLVPLSLQHLLVAYAGMSTMPLLVGTALDLPEDRIRLLISANLLVSGLATLLRSLGVMRAGVRLPIVMGSTFTAITPFRLRSRPTEQPPGACGQLSRASAYTVIASRW